MGGEREERDGGNKACCFRVSAAVDVIERRTQRYVSHSINIPTRAGPTHGGYARYPSRPSVIIVVFH